MYSIQNEMRGVEISRPYRHLIPPILYPNIVHPKHLDFSAHTRQVFWLDIAGPSWPHNRVIRKARLDQDSSKVEIILDASGDHVPFDGSFSKLDIEFGGVSVDWISQVLYYCSPRQGAGKHSTIFAARLDGSHVVKIKAGLHGKFILAINL